MKKTKKQKAAKTRKSQPPLVSVDDLYGDTRVNSELELLVIRAHQVPVLFVTDRAMLVKLHYVDFLGHRGYRHCNATKANRRCGFCEAGLSVTEHLIIPVLDLIDQRMKALSVSTSREPGSLLPLIIGPLKSKKPRVVWIRKLNRYTFEVRVGSVGKADQIGRKEIAGFLKRLEAGEIDLGAVYARMSNSSIRGIPEISRMLDLNSADEESDDDDSSNEFIDIDTGTSTETDDEYDDSEEEEDDDEDEEDK